MEDLRNARRDFLTGCYMRESLLPFLRKMGAEYNAYKSPFSILLIDIDRFKTLNDKYGHLYGDEVLKYFASSLRLGMRDAENMAFRYGGDEFVIVFPGKKAEEAYPFGAELENNVKARSFLYKGRQFKMSFSGGIASFPRDGRTMEEVIERADKAMYYAKRHGHGRCVLYNKIWLDIAKRMAMFFLAGLIIVGIFIFGRFYFGESLSYIIERAQAIQIRVGADRMLDTVFLKSGGVFKGIISRETEKTLDLRLIFDAGEGTIVIEKSKIRNVKRRRR